MKRSLLPLFGVAFVAALAATGIFYALLAPHSNGAAGVSANAMVVVASQPVARGAALRPEDIRLEPWKRGPAPEGALRLAGDAAGRVALRPIEAGEVITAAMLAPAGAGATAAIPPGFRAVSVHPVESHGVVMMLQPGNRVDVQVVSLRGEPSARRLLEDVEVLAVQKADAQKPVVTLLATPEQSDRLSLADALGQLRLLARNPAERAAR